MQIYRSRYERPALRSFRQGPRWTATEFATENSNRFKHTNQPDNLRSSCEAIRPDAFGRLELPEERRQGRQ